MATSTLPSLNNKPLIAYVDQDYSLKPPNYGTFETLIGSIKEYGYLIALGKLGPDAYQEKPSMRDKVNNIEIWSWSKGSYKESSSSVSVILLGGMLRKVNDVETKVIFYTVAEDIIPETKSMIRGFQPSSKDPKIYLMSYENFLKRALVDLYFVCPSDVQWLYSKEISYASILDQGPTEKKCKEAGQKIFDYYKAKTNDSVQAKEALVRICNASSCLSKDRFRNQSIERVWDGVGDKNVRWMA